MADMYRVGKLGLAGIPLLLLLTGFVDKEEAFIGARGKYWAFQKPVRVQPPVVTDAWIRTPIDAFVLAGLQAKNLRPSPPVDRAQGHPSGHFGPDRIAADARRGANLSL